MNVFVPHFHLFSTNTSLYVNLTPSNTIIQFFGHYQDRSALYLAPDRDCRTRAISGNQVHLFNRKVQFDHLILTSHVWEIF